MMWLVWVSVGFMAGLCTGSMQSPWEESTVVPVRLDPTVWLANDTQPKRTYSLEEKQKMSEMKMYRLDAFGQAIILQLEPAQTLLSPGFVFHIVGTPESEMSLEPKRADEHGCFFSGTVNGEEHSAAALNLCQGLSGGFYFQGQEYSIKPLNASDFLIDEEKDEVVHLIRRRARAEAGECGVNEDEDQVPINLEKEPEREAVNKNQTGHHRTKRFVPTPYYLEIMLVADQTMAEFHGAGLKTYLLNIMAVASRLYRHPSLHNSISLTVVKLLVIYEKEQGPQVSSDDGTTLRNFCRWQQRYNPPSDRHPEHYDTAMLFTRMNLCGPRYCDTLGLADVGTVCDPDSSCSIVKDDGLATAFTVAHELGHVLNMPHDDARICSGVNGPHWGSHIMGSKLNIIDQQQPWSACSALTVTTFLNNGYGQCLLDKPVKAEALPPSQPEIVYDGDHQCRLTFGADAKHCPHTPTTCAALWCFVRAFNGMLVCQTKNLPWADGTPCGYNSYCLSGQCLKKSQASKDQIPVNGGWGVWGLWGGCSRTCGGGVQYSFRSCDNPLPSNGGNYCVGKKIQYRSCNTNLCPYSNRLSFREEQCRAHNDMSAQMSLGSGEGVEWVPKYAGVSPKDRCKLVCRAKGTRYFFVLKSKVADGTPCSPDSTSVCVQGQCVRAGCDRVIGSNQRHDKCGVCGGDGFTCRRVSGSLGRIRPGYQDVVTIPAGATHLDIRQRAPGNSYLAVRGQNGTYLLNGDYKPMTMETDITLQGALLRYSGSSARLEWLRSFSPLPEPLTIQVLSVGAAPRPRVKYSYFAPRPNNTASSNSNGGRRHSVNATRELGAEWALTDWGPCSQTCGGGMQQTEVVCLDPQGHPSKDCPEELRPLASRSCASQPCPSWLHGEWSECSKTCGRGFRKRQLRCIGYDGLTLTNDSCDSENRPQTILEQCYQSVC
ncbi:A disintegrin and metalloproteinase with thrombospondin motifs 1-like [Syngnathus typhle]|uniref:A disintegrin and metalloproteinase with thrombospondin motifs 1-like n=1 Tax=Syngnathus typhle TaxID=161592 RepID=UPI002A69E352|nr:A disintegrin and metalloproteinase with thrombospondin motifs 1-like [Syngnathus typhle]